MVANTSVIYLAGPQVDSAEAVELAQQQGFDQAMLLGRRGYQVGWITHDQSEISSPPLDGIKEQWHNMDAIMMPGFFEHQIDQHQSEIEQSKALTQQILEGDSGDEVFAKPPYSERLTPKFELLGASYDESDPQEIETLDFDVMDGDDIIAEGLWVKLSWLSFIEDDESLRFRFSFGIVGYEDVAADYQRQCFAAELTEAIFPESSLVSTNKALQSLLADTLDVNQVDYVERIIYFNAPQGGAQFHQDVERGHLGVVYAQLQGRTGWVALSKQKLIDEILTFMSTADAQEAYLASINNDDAWEKLAEITQDRDQLNSYLDEPDNEPLEYLLNRVPKFTQQLVEHGYAYILNPGDVILLPQKDQNDCCWHTVFCLDKFAGQALSFAIRATPDNYEGS